MSSVTTLHPGHDVAYLTAGQHAGGCAGAMSYYTAAGEPPSQWAGRGTGALGLTGRVDPAVIARLYQHNIGPGGELLVTRHRSRAADEREEAAVAAYRAAHPYAPHPGGIPRIRQRAGDGDLPLGQAIGGAWRQCLPWHRQHQNVHRQVPGPVDQVVQEAQRDGPGGQRLADEQAARAAIIAVVQPSGVGGMIATVTNDPIFEFDIVRVDAARWLDSGQPGTRAVRQTWKAR